MLISLSDIKISRVIKISELFVSDNEFTLSLMPSDSAQQDK